MKHSKSFKLKHELELYLEKLEKFSRSISVTDFVQHWGHKMEPPPGFVAFVTALQINMSEITLWDLIFLKRDLIQEHTLTLFLGSIRKGSTIVTWFIPSYLASYLAQEINTARLMQYMKQHKIECVSFDGKEISVQNYTGELIFCIMQPTT